MDTVRAGPRSGGRRTRAACGGRGLVGPPRDGRTLTLLFAGADGPAARGGCGADYAARAVETPAGVVPVVRQTTPTFWRQVRRFGEATACPAIAAPRSVQVTLDAPLADRAVLSLQTGVPVPQRDVL